MNRLRECFSEWLFLTDRLLKLQIVALSAIQ